MGAPELFAYQNQNARQQRYDSHHDRSDSDVKERSDSDENQIDREQQHSNIFCDHASFLEQRARVCTLKSAARCENNNASRLFQIETLKLRADDLVGGARVIRVPTTALRLLNGDDRIAELQPTACKSRLFCGES